jgi:AcrR family transcriptional regulator
VEKRSVVTVRFASGAVEYWYEAAVPRIGDRVGREASGFVTNVELEGEDRATIYVGTPAPDFVRWDDLASSNGRKSPKPTARERILEAAYALFSERGIRAVGTKEILERAGVARSTLYRHFRSKEELVLAFLQRREQLWTRELVEAEARRRGATPREQLLAIFDVFDEWFHRGDFEGCSFINVLLEVGDLDDPVGSASAAHLEYIRSVVGRIAEEAEIDDADELADSWHILMKGSIVAAGEGDVLAARRARAMGERLLDEHLPQAAGGAPSDENLIARAADVS